MQGRFVIAALMGVSVAVGACGEEERPCQRNYDCGAEGTCTVHECVDGTCRDTPVPEGESPEGDQVRCVTPKCVDGKVKFVQDPSDLPPDDDPNDCKIPSCVPAEGSVNRPNGAPCYFAIHIEGACEAGRCQPPPSPLCNSYCSACADLAECPGCNQATCIERCRELVVRPCGDEREAAMQCAVDAGACESEGCAARVALLDECEATCGVTCIGCGCSSSCDGHSFQTTCDHVGEINTCQCIMDGNWVGSCSEEDATCTAANICCHFW